MSITFRGGLQVAVPKIVVTGAIVGIAGVMLSFWGNPPNSGICVSCFLENIAGSLGFHDNIRMQYIRPEIIGFVLGSFFISSLRKEFRATTHGSPLLRFFVGILLMIGCAVFMGCPIKMILRISAGDMTAFAGLVGLIAGVYIGIKFIEGGFTIGKPMQLPIINASFIPALMFLLLILLIWEPSFILLSTKGAGAEHAPLFIALFAGIIIGVLAQRTGFCVTGGFAMLFKWGPKELTLYPKNARLLMGVFSFFLFALFASLLTGQFSLGLHGQPSSNDSYGWSFLGLLMVGFGSVLIRGCPFRQVILAGQGDLDAGAAVLGMLVGGALVQNWGLGGNAVGTPYEGQLAVLLGTCILFVIGIMYRKRDVTIAPEFQKDVD
jgi:YedE family putative selenium metabolism protein